MKTTSKKIEKCCGNCSWFFGECTDGQGCCAKHYWDEGVSFTHCSLGACDDFISREEKRHHMAVLLQYNRWLRDRHTPRIYKIPKVEDVPAAIDFVVGYIETYDAI